MGSEPPVAEKKATSRLFIPSLAVASVVEGLSGIIFGLLLTDIALTFLGSADPASVGIVSQVNTVVNAVQIFFALLLGFLVIRFRHKPLLLAGILFIAVAAIGNSFAPTLSWLWLFSSLDGVGSLLISVMSITLVGEFVAAKRKVKGISYLMIVSFAASTLGIIGIGVVADLGGWRSTFLLFLMPLAVAGFIICLLAVPSVQKMTQPVGNKQAYVKSFRQVLLNRSAASCLAVTMLWSATGFVGYMFAFYRQGLDASRNFTIGVMLAASIIFIISGLASSRLTKKIGAKTMSALAILGGSIFYSVFFFMPNAWVAFIVHMIGLSLGATGGIAFRYYVLEQVPTARGTMMSMNKMFMNIGSTVGTALGGLVLFYTESYQIAGLTFLGLSAAATVVLLLLTRQPIES